METIAISLYHCSSLAGQTLAFGELVLWTEGLFFAGLGRDLLSAF
jgi:hypothetical protein